MYATGGRECELSPTRTEKEMQAMKNNVAIALTLIGAVLAVVFSVVMCEVTAGQTVWGVCMLLSFAVMAVGLLKFNVAKQ